MLSIYNYISKLAVLKGVLFSIYGQVLPIQAMEDQGSHYFHEIEDFNYLPYSSPIIQSEEQSPIEISEKEILREQLDHKPYYIKAHREIQRYLEKLDEGYEIEAKLFIVFSERIYDYKNFLKTNISPAKYFQDTLQHFTKVGIFPELITLYQQIYLNYQFEGLLKHYYCDRSYFRQYLESAGLVKSRSLEALEKIEYIACSLNVKIDPTLLGAKAVNEFIYRKCELNTILFEYMAKMDLVDKKCFLKGACDHLKSEYFHRTFTPLLEQANVRKSTKRLALEDVLKIKSLLNLDHEHLFSNDLDRLQKESVNEILENALKSLDSYIKTFHTYKGWLLSYIWSESSQEKEQENVPGPSMEPEKKSD